MITNQNDTLGLRPLELDAVQTFALIADLGSFTRAAEATGTTQSAVSMKLQRLEARLGQRLVERTPRLVRLTAEGVIFLPRAKDLLAAHQRALVPPSTTPQRLVLGISDHAAGPEFPMLLAKVKAYDPSLALEIRIGLSGALLDAFDGGELQAVIVRREAGRRGGEKLVTDQFGWFATPDFRPASDGSLAVAMLAPPCGVRAAAIRALDKAGVRWREAFTGGGIAAVAAAVVCGIGVAALARRIAPPGTVDVGEALKLPPLGKSDVLLHSHVSEPRARAALRTLAAAFRTATR
jgi:DNA-binding transcriptional LysR family regulator